MAAFAFAVYVIKLQIIGKNANEAEEKEYSARK